MTAPMPTPTLDSLPRRLSDFATLGEALDYAAQGVRGLNFHDMRGALARPYPFSEMRADALNMAYRLISHGVKPEDRIALIAETGPDFAALFFGCVYAGAWPVPLPLPTSFGGKESYIDQISVQLKSCDPKILFFPAELSETAGESARQNGVEALTISVTCNIRAARHASRMVLQLPTRRCSTICRHIRMGWN
jgi:fatty-acyl-CoA synthase